MEKRPIPTKNLVQSLCGGNFVIDNIHHGLHEVPFELIYPVLDFNELLAFAGGSWKARKDLPSFKKLLEEQDLYGTFQQVRARSGVPAYHDPREVPEILRRTYDKITPFKGKGLRERLEAVGEEDVQAITEALQERTKSYYFEIQFEKLRDSQKADAVCMGFQNKYPKRERNIQNFAQEISRMIGRFPQEYETLDELTSDERRTGQMRLF